MVCYPAVIEYDREDDAYNVRFPDVPGCLTFGNNIDDARENAKEALSAYLDRQPQTQGACSVGVDWQQRVPD